MEPKELTHEEKGAAVHYLMFLMKKRLGTIMERGCANGRKQRAYTTKEESSLLTVAIKSVLLSCAVDVEEKREIATVDIPGTFMQANTEVHMKLVGKMAELLVKLDPKLYCKYMQTIGKRQVLFGVGKSTIWWDSQSCPTILEKAKHPVKEMGFQDQSM
jgi:hypothetical protein